ncbi:MAG: DNA-binding response regulator [Cellvibrionaceae bacterium]|nr:DNA-binding response regulator [Cellvibrionaceae bacterium]|tara:strand:- start:9238 stop:9849 length:612 start_codon:yes stop_codon:yes gene_type:complete
MTIENTVFIVDDDRDFRDSLAWLVEGGGHKVVAYESAEAFLFGYGGQPGCVLLDVRMSGMSGLQLQQEMIQRGLSIPVIMITGHGDVPMAVQAMKNNAIDFIEKPFEDVAMLTLIDKTLADNERVLLEQNQHDQILAQWSELSRRENDVAKLVIQGQANREIADALGISIKTVEIHRSRVMSKMKVKRLAELMEKVSVIKTSI